jgi:hypothetical protein
VGDELAIISHPSGRPKEISTGTAVEENGFYLLVDVDTESGSSGGGLFDRNSGQLVGLHFRADCSGGEAGNGFVQMDNLLLLSPILRALAEPAPPPSDVNPALSFEAGSGWNVVSGSISSNTEFVTDGASSLRVIPQSFTTLLSPQLNTLDLTDGATALSVDLYIGHNQPNPWWIGNLQLLFHIPSAGIYNQYVFQIQLNDTPRGQFITHQFSLPSNIVLALAAPRSDVQVRFALNANAGSGPYYFDDIQFQ